MLHNENIYSSEWITSIIDTLNGCGLSYVRLEQEYMNPEYVKRRVQLTLEDQYLQSWKQSLFDSNKCKFYRIIKKEFKLENYLLLLSYNRQKILTWFRTPNHKLPIEKRRHLGIDVSKCKCPLRKSDSIGDEGHYVVACPYICETREKYLGKSFYNENEIQLHHMFYNETILKT